MPNDLSPVLNSEKLLDTLFAEFPGLGVMVAAADGRVLFCSEGFLRLFGSQARASEFERVADFGQQGLDALLARCLAGSDGRSGMEDQAEIPCGPAQERRLARVRVRRCAEECAPAPACLFLAEDSGTQAHPESGLRLRTDLFDLLTGLPNRRLFLDRLYQARAQADRQGTLLAVCYLDLDGFRAINGSLGSGVGDLFLLRIGERLHGAMRIGDTAARWEGDRFALLLNGLKRRADVNTAAERLVRLLSVTHDEDGRVFRVTASIGVTLYPSDRSDGDTLVRHADYAMCLAKEDGGNRFRVYEPQVD